MVITGSRDCVMREEDFSNRVFPAADKTMLDNVEFVRCNFSETSFHNIYAIKGCIFTSCFFSSAELAHVQFEECKFLDCSFKFVYMSDVQFRDCDMSGSQFIDAEFGPLVVCGGDWSNTGLRHLDFKGHRFSGVRFNGADLTGSCFADCSIEGCSFDGAVMDDVVYINTVITEKVDTRDIAPGS